MFGPQDAQGELLGGPIRSFAPAGRGDGRIGVVDVGSNSVRFVVFEGGRRSPAMLFNEKVMAGLGAQLQQTGRLCPAGKDRALAALCRFAAVADSLHVSALSGVATAAIRDAEDGTAFRDRIEERTGIRLLIASGEDEARLAAQGVLFGTPSADGVAVDLGGASMELCRIENGRVGRGVSTPLGPLRLNAFRDEKAALDEIETHLVQAAEGMKLPCRRLYLVGGSWRALARAQMERTDYPLKLLHEYVLDADTARDLAAWAAASAPADLARIPGVSESRAPALPMAGHLLSALVRVLRPDDLMISGFGLREGICLANLPMTLRSLDPLLAAARGQERTRARAPGFGAELAEWVLRILPAETDDDARLIRAASHLADVNWRAHPDYRIDACWDSVTRATITNIGHAGRAMMGAALAVRYRRNRKLLTGHPPLRVLSEAQIDKAVLIGLAMRTGTTLAASAPGLLPRVPVELTKTALTVTLPADQAELAGEEPEKRLGHLADALGVEARLQVA